MLGQDSKILPPVVGHYAEDMRDALRRVRLNQLNDADKRTMLLCGYAGREMLGFLSTLCKKNEIIRHPTTFIDYQ